MRYEFHRNGTTVGSAQWEGPGQVHFDVEAEARETFRRYFQAEEVYLSGSDDGMDVRRRDWTPWEFERACRAFATKMGYRAERTPNAPVEERAQA